MMIANEGQVAVQVVEEEVGEVGKTGGPAGILKKAADMEPFDLNEADFRSRDIQILTGDDDEDEEEKALKEYRLKMAALLPDAG